MGLWSALTRPSSRFWERPPWMKEKIGIRWSHTSSSHTGKFPRHPLGSSNCYTAGLYVGPWMFFGRHGVSHALHAAKDGTDERDNLTRPQQWKKRWYDRTAREREFQQGGLVLVLVLLPTSTHKLLTKWKGPYPTPMLAPSPDWTDASNALVQEKGRGMWEAAVIIVCLSMWFVHLHSMVSGPYRCSCIHWASFCMLAHRPHLCSTLGLTFVLR